MSNNKKIDFNHIVLTHQREVYFFIRKMVLNHDDANDITQNTFIKAWKGIDTFRNEAKLSTWLYRIAYNETMNFIHKKNRIAGVSLDNIENDLPTVLAADSYFSGDEIQLLLTTAIASLPEKQKSVFILKYYEDKSYQEIAEITGTSVGGLKASFFHAKNKIEDYIKKNSPN